MTPFTFKSPNTGFTVQGIADPDISAPPFYQAILCTACQQTHLVDPRTGLVAGQKRSGAKN
jgi:hypothetical protein